MWRAQRSEKPHSVGSQRPSERSVPFQKTLGRLFKQSLDNVYDSPRLIHYKPLIPIIKTFYHIDIDETPGLFFFLKNHIFIARNEDTIFIFHM